MDRFVRLTLIAMVATYAGCGKKQASSTAEVVELPTETSNVRQGDERPSLPELAPDPSEPPKTETTQETAEVETGHADATADEPTAPPEESTAEKEVNVEPPETLAVDVSEETEMVETPVLSPAYRMFLPTTAGPLIVDAEIRMGDELLSEVFDRRIQKVIQEARDDPDADLTWNDLFSYVTGDPEQFGRQTGFNRGQYRQVSERFDRNRNQRPDADEVARFLFRNSGVDVAFRLIGTDYYREINRSESVLFTAIDANDDGRLDEAELDAAPQALFRFDPNADQRIDPSEVIVVPDNDPAWDRRRSSRRGEVAMDFEGYVDWTMVSYSIDAMSGSVPFSLAQNPIERIDENGDKSISSAEAKELSAGRPDLRLKITFSQGSDEPAIEVVSQRPELESLVVTKRSPSELALSDQSFTLLASAIDSQASRNRIPRAAFEMLDANNDGVLQEDEIPAAASEQFSFEELDADDDGELTYQEINSAQESKAQLPIWSAQVRARGAEFPDGVFAWLDENHDQFLSTREILTADKRLRQCKPDGQVVKPTDIPDTFAIQFMHADPMQDQQNFAFAATIQPQLSAWPRWAQNMDVNRDGEISEIEFPGSPDRFQKLDTNGDGFIDADEIATLAD